MKKWGRQARILDIGRKPRVRQDNTSSIIDQDEHCEREEDNDDRQSLCSINDPISILLKHISETLTPANREGHRQRSSKYQNKCSDQCPTHR